MYILAIFILCIMKNVIFTINFKWQIVTDFNLRPPLKLFFYPPITTNNNPPPKIYCENIIKMLWT